MPQDRDPSALVAEVLTSADVEQEDIPRLLGLLDEGDRQVQLGAATALCVIAEQHPIAVPSLVDRLADRSGGSAAAALAVDYLAVQYPDTVAESLDELAGTDRRDHALERSSPTRVGPDNRDVGRTSVAGEGRTPGPRRVYTDDEDEETGGHAEDETDAGNTMGQRPQAADAEWRSLVEYESRFDRLSVLAARERRRYSDSYRTLGVIDEDEYAVALRLLRGGGAAVEAFEAALSDRLADWAAVADAGNVVTLYDWNDEPRFWVATEYTDERLSDRGRFAPAEAAWHAERLADGVATLHERGVVHGGIDAESVAYYGNVLRESDRQPPLLDNVGLLSVYRQYFDPSEFLDPRYAAPEYYERRFGSVDHATDIYQLGAVCYRLFTGRAPYGGDFESVRESVLSAEPPVPTSAADVPPAVDDIVGKAMATEKLGRYETAAHMRQELRSLTEEGRDE